jgi:hypothetical protein
MKPSRDRANTVEDRDFLDDGPEDALSVLLSDMWVAARVGTIDECNTVRGLILRHVVESERAAFFNGAVYGELEGAITPPDDFPMVAHDEAARRYRLPAKVSA